MPHINPITGFELPDDDISQMKARFGSSSPVEINAPDPELPQPEPDPAAQARRVLGYTLEKSQDAGISAFTAQQMRGLPVYAGLEDEKLANAAAREYTLDALNEYSPGTLEALADLPTASLVHNEIPLADRFHSLLSAPADIFHAAFSRVNSSRALTEAANVLPRAPFNIAESTYQGIQFLGGVMQAAGLRDAGQAVEQFGRRQSDISRALLSELEPAQGRLSSEEILNDPSMIFSDEGIAAIIGNMGDMAAKMAPSAVAFVFNPVLGTFMAGGAEGAAFYEKQRKDGTPISRAIPTSLSFAMVTALLERMGLNATLARNAPRTATTVLERTFGVVGSKLDAAVAKLPVKGQAVANAVRAGVVEGTTEYLENPIQGALEGVAKQDDISGIWARTLEGARDWTPFLYAGLFGAGVHGVSARGHASQQPLDAAQFPAEQRGVAAAIAETADMEFAARQRVAFGEALTRAAETGDQTKLKSKNRAAFEAAYSRLVPEDAQTVFIDPENVIRFAQGEFSEDKAAGQISPSAIDQGKLEQLGLDEDAVRVASLSGAPISVQAIKLLSMQPGQERSSLIESARQAPDGLSWKEAQAFDPQKKLDEAVKALADQAAAERKAKAAAMNGEKDRIRQELTEAGFNKEVADRYVALHVANAEAFASRYNEDPISVLRSRKFARQNEEEVHGGGGGGDDKPSQNTLAQTQSEPAGERGQVSISNGNALVGVFNGRDLSTILHESTHIFLSNLEEIAAAGNDAAIADIRTLRQWAGLTENGELAPGEYSKFQEMVATAGEAYFMEGKAPAGKLRRVFSAFRSWLLTVYKNMQSLFSAAGFEGHTLTDEVRSVFDRMLTTDDIVANSRERAELFNDGKSMLELFAKEDQEDMASLLAAADEEARSAINKQALKDRAERLREFRALAKDAVNQDPFWETVDYVARKDGAGLNREQMEREYGKAAVRDLNKAKPGIVRNGGIPLDVIAQEMAWPDSDTLFNELSDRLISQRQTKRGQAEALAQRLLADEDAAREQDVDKMSGNAYGEYLDALDKAINRQLLKKQKGMQPWQIKRIADSLATPRKALQYRAQEEIGKAAVEDISPAKFNAALRKGQKRVHQLLKKGDAAEALQVLQQARLANELYIQSMKARKQADKIIRQAKKSWQIKPEMIDPMAREGLRRVLTRFSMTRVPEEGQDPVTAKLGLREIIAALNPDADIIMEGSDSIFERSGQTNLVVDSFPEWLVNESTPLSSTGPRNARAALPFKQLTMDQLEDVGELVGHLAHVGRAASLASKASEAARIETLAVAGSAPMERLKALSVAEEGSARERWQRVTRRFLSEHEALTSIFRRADGFANVGPKGKAGPNEIDLLQPLLDGENHKKLLWRGLSEQMDAPVQRLVKRMAELNAQYGEKLGSLKCADGSALQVPEKMREVGRTWTPERVFGMALQLGNQSNMERLKSGFPDLDPETVSALLGDDAAARIFGAEPVESPRKGLLTAEDWHAIQGMWDAINSLWPETEATHRNLLGFAPKKVQESPLTLRIGEETVSLAGGYFPVKYDPRLSETASARKERDDILRSGQTGFMPPAAKRGFTMARTQKAPGEALRLDLGQVMQHLEEATTFIALGPAVRNADRVTRNPSWKAAYVRAFGEQEYSAIRENLKGLVGKELSQTAGQDIAQMFRKLVTYYALSWNMNTVMMQTDAVLKSMADQGARPVLEGLSKLMRPGAVSIIRDIESVSPYMESRSKNLDRDLAEGVTDMAKKARQQNKLSVAGAGAGLEKVAEAGLVPMRVMDMAVSSAVWMGAYNAKMRELHPGGVAGIDSSSAHHKAAMAHADNMVKRANPDWDGTSRTKFMRAPGYNLFNMFSSATEMIFQRQRLAFGAFRAGQLDALEYARYELYDMVLPATAFYLMGEAAMGIFGSDDEKKKQGKKSWERRYLENLVDYAAPSLPIVGPAISAALINGQQSQSRNVLDKPMRLAVKTFNNGKASITEPQTRKRQEAQKNLGLNAIDFAGFLSKLPLHRAVRYGKKLNNTVE